MSTQHPIAAPAPRFVLPADAPGVNVRDFITGNRIHIEGTSFFISPVLMLNWRELDPKNEAATTLKMRQAYTDNKPSFFAEVPEKAKKKGDIAKALGKLLSPSLTAQSEKLHTDIEAYKTKADLGYDPESAERERDKRAPMTANLREETEKKPRDTVADEKQRNALTLYLLCREKLKQNGYPKSLTSYVVDLKIPDKEHKPEIADQILEDIAGKMGVPAQKIREAAIAGGVDAVGQALGLNPLVVGDIKACVDHAATHNFSENIIKNWGRGRFLLGPQATPAAKMEAGVADRIRETLAEYRRELHGRYELPADAQAEEKRVAEALEVLEPIQRALLYRTTTQIGYTSQFTIDSISANKNNFGLNDKSTTDPQNSNVNHLYFSRRGDLKSSLRTLAHEAFHNVWPSKFSAEEAAHIDQLAYADAKRFDDLKTLMNEKFPEFSRFIAAYKTLTTAEEKQSYAAAAPDIFKSKDGTVLIDPIMVGYIDDPILFRGMVEHACDRLHVNGELYNHSKDYQSPQQRFREVLSRFAELKQVEHRAQPQLLHYLAPGLDTIYERHMLPHMERVYASLDTTKTPVNATPAAPHRAAEVPVIPAAAMADSIVVNTPPQTQVNAASIPAASRLAASAAPSLNA